MSNILNVGTYVQAKRVLHQVHRGLEDGPALGGDQLSQGAGEEARVGESKAAIPVGQQQYISKLKGGVSARKMAFQE
jgi:hypothetical protein